MRFIDLFCGVGAFRLGLEQAGHECVFSNEWLAKPASIYERNFGERPDTRDIRTITIDTIPDADLVVGGFPCGTFSIAGKRTGLSLEDARGELFYEMFRLARDKGIPFILFENVEGLLNHDGGRTFGFMLTVLDEMGYDAQWELLDSQNFAIPQHRERVFVLGHSRERRRPQVFPIGRPEREDAGKNGSEPKGREGLFSDISPTLDANYYKGGASRPYVVVPQREPDASSATAADMGLNGHSTPSARRTGKMHMRSHTKANMKQKEQERDSVWTLDSSPQNKMAVDTGLGYRRLTPLDCERLQGLPDGWTKYYADGSLVSDSERYERCGRAVTVTVIKAIGEKLKIYEQGSAS